MRSLQGLFTYFSQFTIKVVVANKHVYTNVNLPLALINSRISFLSENEVLLTRMPGFNLSHLHYLIDV